MLGKNILSIIGLLFVGRTLAQQTNSLPECEGVSGGMERKREFNSANCKDTGDTVSYCIDSETNKMYEVTNLSTHACKASTLSEGVHVFMNKGESGISEINLTGGNSNPIGEGNKEKLSMYLCDKDNVCKQTEGYIKVSYGTDGSDSEEYYKIGLDSSSEAGNGDECDGDTNIGLQSTGHGVCLSVKGESVEFGAEQNYILDGTIASGSIFKSVANSKDGIVLTRDVSKIYFNNIYTDEEFCKYEDKKIIKRKEQFVSGTILNTLYDCEYGACDISKVPENVEDGEYLVDGKIFKREGAEIKEKIVTGIFASKQSDPNDITYENLLSSGDIGELTSNNLGSVYLYDCVNGVCTRTSGFIKYGSTAALAECTKENECKTLESVDCTEETEDGKINLDNGNMKLCVSESLSSSTYNLIGNTMYETNSNKNIIGAKQTGNFLSGNNLIVCTDGKCESPGNAAGYYLNSNSEEITAGTKLISCIDVNNCKLIEQKNGYYINESSNANAIICDATADGVSCKENVLATSCNDNANKLVYDGNSFKYCEDSENLKEMPTAENVNLYEVSDVKASGINYPTDFIESSSGNKMVIQVDQYSVTQYVDASPFCIDDKSKVIKEKCIDGDIKYTCNTVNSKCDTIEVGKCVINESNENCDGYYVKNDGELYNCDGKGTCNKETKIGYFRNMETYIKCTNDGSKITCANAENVDVNSLDENKCDIGKLIIGDTIKLCVDNVKENAITIFTNEDSKKYFIKASGLNSKDSIVSSQKHYIVNVAENEVLTETVTDYKKYKYIKSTGTPAILVKGEGSITAAELVEFTKSKDNDNTYEKEVIGSA